MRAVSSILSTNFIHRDYYVLQTYYFLHIISNVCPYISLIQRIIFLLERVIFIFLIKKREMVADTKEKMVHVFEF